MTSFRSTRRRVVIAIAVLTPVALAGCAKKGHRFDPVTNAHLQEVNSVNLMGTTPSVNTIETGTTAQHLHLTFDDGGSSHTCEVVLGPGTSVAFSDGDASFMIYRGWIYLVGYSPRVRTARMSAAAHGSKLIVQVASELQPSGLNGPVYRAFYLDGVAPAELNPTDGHLWSTMTLPIGRFTQLHDWQYAPDAPATYATNPNMNAIVTDVLNYASMLGV